MAKMKYAEVRSIISNLLDDEDFAKVEAAFTPTTPTVTSDNSGSDNTETPTVNSETPAGE